MEVLTKLQLTETNDLLLVSIKSQKMYHQKEGKSVKTYVISTSLNPPSCQENSLGTPWGLHEVNEIIGLDQPKGMVFQGRRPIDLCYWECKEEMKKKNLITSRILRLQGLEPGLNLGKGEGIDTYERYVYVHGTNKEDKLGYASSSGCIQVSNESAIELAAQIPLGTHLFISLA
ncbi:MAG: L,D-transpeptidase [Opitutae bacterium]